MLYNISFLQPLIKARKHFLQHLNKDTISVKGISFKY